VAKINSDVVLRRGNNSTEYEPGPESLFVGVRGVNISKAYKTEIAFENKKVYLYQRLYVIAIFFANFKMILQFSNTSL